MNTGPEGEFFMPRRARRTFASAFKAEVVRQLLAGEHTSAELCREHQLSASLLSLWRDAALERLHLLFEDAEQRDPQQARIADLEQLVGRQALELEILKKVSGLRAGSPGSNGRSS
jgi:transposase-like protein